MEDKYRIVEMEFIDFILDKLYENPVQVNITFPESNMLISREGSTDLADQQWLINIVSDYMSIAEQIVSCVIETDVFHLTIVPPVADDTEAVPKWDVQSNTTEAPTDNIIVENQTPAIVENESNVEGPSFHDLCIALDELFDGTVGTEKRFGNFTVSCTSTDVLHRWSFIPTNMPGAEQYRNVHYMVIDPAYDTVTINTDKQSCRIKGIHRGMAEVADTCYLEDGFINELIAAYIIHVGKDQDIPSAFTASIKGKNEPTMRDLKNALELSFRNTDLSQTKQLGEYTVMQAVSSIPDATKYAFIKPDVPNSGTVYVEFYDNSDSFCISDSGYEWSNSNDTIISSLPNKDKITKPFTNNLVVTLKKFYIREH